jgi:SpoVK/Ycf46/Vps4 family AAA+-type ATPase
MKSTIKEMKMANPTSISQEDDEAKDISINLIEPTHSSRYFVPNVFQNQIKLHYIKSTMPDLMSPLILAIQGATGQGKTFQCLETFSQMGVNVLLVFGFELSGKYEGEPVRKMQKLYDFALEYQNKYHRPTAVIIDDFDNSIVSVRNDGHSGYSVNTQLLTDYFMNLPHKIPRDKVPVPIVLTGNNFLNIYEPLVRYGRMSFFDWSGPTGADKIKIISKVFSNTVPDFELENIELIIEVFSNQNMAFFNELRNAAHDVSIIEMCSHEPLNVPYIHDTIRRRNGHLTIAELIKVGQLLLENRPKDFLSSEKVVTNPADGQEQFVESKNQGEINNE